MLEAMGSGGARTTRAAAAALILSFVLFPSVARAGDEPPPAGDRAEEDAAFAADVAKAYEPFRAKLEALGQWCEISTLLIERARIATALLALEPENAAGRRWLRWSREKGGPWKQKSQKPFFDEKPELMPEWEKRRSELASPLRAALQPFLENAGDWRTAGTRDKVLRLLVALHPDDAALHEAYGETRAGTKWVLKESAAAAAGRTRIRDLAASADKDAAQLASSFVKSQVPGFAFGLGPPTFMVASQVAVPEAIFMASRVAAAKSLYDRVFDTRTRFRNPFTICLFGGPADAARYLDTRTEIPAERRSSVRRLGTYWLNGNEVVVASTTPEWRTDACVRQVLSSLAGDGVQLMDAPAWMGEGFGMYLTHALIGTRLTPFFSVSTYSSEGLRKETEDPNSDWVKMVRRLVIEESRPPNLRLLTSLPLNSMAPEDTLFAFALAAYFLEGRPKDAFRLMCALKEGGNFHRVLAETLGMDAEGLEARFVRWLAETK